MVRAEGVRVVMEGGWRGVEGQQEEKGGVGWGWRKEVEMGGGGF